MTASMKQKYRMTFRCKYPECKEVFKKITTNKDLSDPPCPACKKREAMKVIRMGDGAIPQSEIDRMKEKPKKKPNVIYKCSECFSVLRVHEEVGETSLEECPICHSENVSYIEHIGSSKISDHSKIQIKAVDETSRIVMDDYKMGDLKDRVYEGEAMAPQLQPHLQKQADSFFGGSGNAARKKLGINTASIAKRAMAGAYAPGRTGAINPVAATHASRIKPPTQIIASTDGKS